MLVYASSKMAEKDLVPHPSKMGVMAGKEHAEFNGPSGETERWRNRGAFLIGRIKKICPVRATSALQCKPLSDGII